MAKNAIKGSSKDGYKINGRKVSKADAYKYANKDVNYEVYRMKTGTKVIRSKPDGIKGDNVNHDK